MAPSTDGVLNGASLLPLMSTILPQQSADTVIFKDSYAAVALLSHACMLAVGFRLIGLGEDHKLDTQSDSSDDRRLPKEWQDSSTYAFRYAHSQSSMEFLLKVNRLGSKALIFGLGLGDDKTASFEVKAQDYISETSLKDGKMGTDPQLTMAGVYISANRITDFSSLFKSSIIQKLAPGLHKEGYEDTTIPVEQPRRHQETRPPEPDPLRDDQPLPARPYPFQDPLAAPPRRPVPAGDFPPPDFEDEYEVNRPPRGMPGGGRTPFGNLGDRDLYPPGLGPYDPLRIGPGGGGFRGGGGMHPTFDDPLFGGQGDGRAYDPRAPPGARYDPVGPGDGPPNLRGGPRFPGGGGGGFGGNPFGRFGSGDFI